MPPRALAPSVATLALAASALLAGLPSAAAATTEAYSYRPAAGSTRQAGAVVVTDPARVQVLADGGHLTLRAGGERMDEVDVALPTGAVLAPGLTFPLGATVSPSTGTATSFADLDCVYLSGTVTVHEWVGDAGGATVAAVDVTGSCGTAQLRIGTDRAWGGLSVDDRVSFGSSDVLELVVRDVVVTVGGTSPVSFTDAEVLTDPSLEFEDFGVMDDGCTGTLVGPGGSCTFSVGFAPIAAGPASARLVVRDGTTTGMTTVWLDGTGTTDATGTYTGLDAPQRLLDTRKVGAGTPLAAGSTTQLQVGNTAGVPASGVSAVVLNLTAVGTTAPGYFTLYPSGMPRPTVSSVNFPKGWTGANMVTVPLSTDGKVSLYNFGGSAHAVVDVLGFYWADRDHPLAGQLFPMGDAVRLFDSRTDGGALRGGQWVDLDGVFGDPDESADVSDFVVTVTAVGATRPGVLTAWSGEGTRPTASTVNYEPKVIAPNMAVVRAGHRPDGAGFRISNTSSGTVHVVVDLVGINLVDSPYGLRFTPLGAPTRVLDTRKAIGLSGAFGPAQTRTVNASAVAGADTFALVANTTGIAPTRQTFMSVWAAETGAVRPDSSILNVSPGLVRAVATYAPLGSTSRFRLYNGSGSMHVAMDVAGTLDFYPRSTDATSRAAAGAASASDAGGLPVVRDLAGHDLRPRAVSDPGDVIVTRGS